MSRIFYLIGKSSTGKDSLLEALLADPALHLREIVQYTARPIRDGEQEGREYHFITMAESEELERAGKVVEARVYQTVHGPWKYMLVDDGQIADAACDYIAVGTVESYRKVRDYYGEEAVIPLYIYVETGERLFRALKRERTHDNPKYAEMCRRFLADEQDFSEEKLREAGLLLSDGSCRNGFENVDFQETLQNIREWIIRVREGNEGQSERGASEDR